MTPSDFQQAVYAIVIFSKYEDMPWSYAGPFLSEAAAVREADELGASGHRAIVVALKDSEVMVVGDEVAYPPTLQDDIRLRCLLDDRNHPTHWLNVIQDYEDQIDTRVQRLKLLESENCKLRARVAELEARCGES